MILILLFGAIFAGNGSSTVPVYIQNNDNNSPGSQAFITALNSTNAMTITIVSPGVNFSQYLAAQSGASRHRHPVGVPSRHLREAARSVSVTIYGNPTSSTSGAVLGVTQAVIDGFNLHLANASVVVNAQSVSVASRTYKYIDYLVPGLIGFSVLTTPCSPS